MGQQVCLYAKYFDSLYFSVQCLVYSKFKLLYTVKVSGDGLTTALSVTNLNGMQAQLMYILVQLHTRNSVNLTLKLVPHADVITTFY